MNAWKWRLSCEAMSRCWRDGFSFHGRLKCWLSLRLNCLYKIHANQWRLRRESSYEVSQYRKQKVLKGCIKPFQIQRVASWSLAYDPLLPEQRLWTFQGLLHLQIGNVRGDNNLCKTSTTLERELYTRYECRVWERHCPLIGYWVNTLSRNATRVRSTWLPVTNNNVFQND